MMIRCDAEGCWRTCAAPPRKSCWSQTRVFSSECRGKGERAYISLPAFRSRLRVVSKIRQLFLGLDQLLAHMHDHLDTGQIDAQLVDKALDEANLLDILCAE